MSDAALNPEDQAWVDKHLSLAGEAPDTARRRNRQVKERARSDLLRHCRPARYEDYADWYTAFCDIGACFADDGEVFPQHKWFVLTSFPSAVPSLYGAESVTILVPSDLGFRPEHVPRTFFDACGHSTFFFLPGDKLLPPGEFVGSWVDLGDPEVGFVRLHARADYYARRDAVDRLELPTPEDLETAS